MLSESDWSLFVVFHCISRRIAILAKCLEPMKRHLLTFVLRWQSLDHRM